MKIKTFVTGPRAIKKNTAPRIHVTPRGVIAMNIMLSEKLKLKPGMGVDFHQDEEESKDWYISVNEKSLNKVRQKKSAKSFLFNNVRLTDAIISSICPDNILPTVTFFVAQESIEVPGIEGPCFAIITSSAKK